MRPTRAQRHQPDPSPSQEEEADSTVRTGKRKRNRGSYGGEASGPSQSCQTQTTRTQRRWCEPCDSPSPSQEEVANHNVDEVEFVIGLADLVTDEADLVMDETDIVLRSYRMGLDEGNLDHRRPLSPLLDLERPGDEFDHGEVDRSMMTTGGMALGPVTTPVLTRTLALDYFTTQGKDLSGPAGAYTPPCGKDSHRTVVKAALLTNVLCAVAEGKVKKGSTKLSSKQEEHI